LAITCPSKESLAVRETVYPIRHMLMEKIYANGVGVTMKVSPKIAFGIRIGHFGMRRDNA